MNRKRGLWLIIGTGIVITLVVAVLALRVVFNCCALPPTPPTLTAIATIMTRSLGLEAVNETTVALLHETQTAAITPSPTALFPYDPTLYAQRRQDEMMLRTGAGPTQYAIFFATEAALIATYQGTVLPTVTPQPRPTLPYDPTLYAQRRQDEMILQTGAGPTQYAIFFATETALVATYQSTVLPTATHAIASPTPQLPTPPPYDATLYPQRRQEEERIKTNTGPIYTAEYFYATETALVETYQGTALPTFTPSRTFTPTATLCPPSDVICPGGNATPNAAQIVLGLMASASAPEFGQLAQTATALYVTPTATSTPTAAGYGSCVFSWANQDLPEITAEVRIAFVSAEMTAINVIRANAYGENCSSGGTQRFLAMTTDFYLTADVDDLTDTDKIGQIITDTYSVLMNLDVELPARRGYLDIEFKEGSEVKRFRAMFSEIQRVIEAQASGAEILKEGGGLG